MKETNYDEKWIEDHQRNAPSGTFDTAPVEEAIDPLSPEVAPGLSLIVLMRIYDTQLALLRESNPQVAERLAQLHAEGEILGSMPWVDPEKMNGQ